MTIVEDMFGNMTYKLQENEEIRLTEYKVLQGNKNSSLLSCIRMKCDGKDMLYYPTTGKRKLSQYIAAVDVDVSINALYHFLLAVVDVSENGFLSFGSMQLDLENVYIEPNTNQCQLIYLPVKNLKAVGMSDEMELRSSVIRYMDTNIKFNTPLATKLRAQMCDATMSLSQIVKKTERNIVTKATSLNTQQTKIANEKNVLQSEYQSNEDISQVGTTLILSGQGSVNGMQILINDNYHKLGRKQEICDTVIPNCPAIGREHCAIMKNSAGYVVQDLNSSNGTFVNHTKLPKGGSMELHANDILTLANISFIVEITR